MNDFIGDTERVTNYCPGCEAAGRRIAELETGSPHMDARVYSSPERAVIKEAMRESRRFESLYVVMNLFHTADNLETRIEELERLGDAMAEAFVAGYWDDSRLGDAVRAWRAAQKETNR